MCGPRRRSPLRYSDANHDTNEATDLERNDAISSGCGSNVETAEREKERKKENRTKLSRSSSNSRLGERKIIKD